MINVTWGDAQRYVAWLSKITGRRYRLLTEAEYEYAARAGSTTPYPWGDDIGQNNANCKGCGSLADGTLLRLQGGARFGFEGAWNGIRMSMVVTGLLYDDVLVAGGVLATSPNPLILSDEGKLRAEGILALNFYHGNGVSSFAQADLVGGEGLFGVAGKVGVRVAW